MILITTVVVTGMAATAVAIQETNSNGVIAANATARTLSTRQSKICGVTALWRAVAMTMEVRKVLVKEA